MKQYPRIFSLSTVGIIYHNNCDYLLHPLRTDFTGGSGSGKSVIADLLQLIFVAKKEYWESSTEVMTSEKRTIEGMVLKHDAVAGLGYTFANVEVDKGKFILVGIHIQTNSRAVYPFIIQKGGDFNPDTDLCLEPMDGFLLYRDFLYNKQILPIDQMKEVVEKRGYQLKHFYNRTAEFHRLLYGNEILGIDLSQDEKKLKTFSQILQSFSRGKGIGSKSDDLKNFLFANDDDQNKEYEKRKKEIEDAHEEYKRRARVYELVKLKKDRLLALLEDKKKRDKALQRSLFLETGYAFQHKDVVSRDLVRTQKEVAYVNLQQIMFEKRVNELNIESIERELDEITGEHERLERDLENKKKQREFAEKNRASYEKGCQISQADYDEASAKWTKVKVVESWLRTYKTVDGIRAQFYSQEKTARDKQKFEELEQYLVDKAIYDEFMNSTWSQDYRLAQAEYDGLTDQLDTDILRLEQILPLFDSESTDSVVQWAISNAGKLTREEESILMHFKGLTTSKPEDYREFARYIPKPEEIFNIKVAEKEDKGIWIDMGGVREFVSLVPKQIFNNPKTIESELKKYGDTIEKELEKLTAERNNVRHLRDLLYEFGYNQQVADVWMHRKEYASFNPDETLLFTKEEFENTIDLYVNPQNNLRLQYEEAKKSWEDALQKLKEADDIITNSQGNEQAIESLIKQINTADLPERERELKNFQQERKSLDERFADWLKDVANYMRPSEGEQFQVKVNSEIKAIEKEHGSSSKMLWNGFTQRLQEISRKQGGLDARLVGLMEQAPMLEARYRESHKQYTEKVGEFNPADITEQIEESVVNKAKVSVITTQKTYESNFDQIMRDPNFNLVDEERLKYNHLYDFLTLAECMLPKIIKNPDNVESDLASDVEEHLRIINQKMNEINDHKLKIISGIFSRIEEVYSEYRDRVEDMREFFKQNKISGGHYVEINFEPSKGYPISWIRSLNKQISAKAQNVGLFKMFETENEGADAIILKAFLEHSDGKNVRPDVKKLTNPKSYFDLMMSLKTPRGEDAPGSNGQNYTMLALLCIARLSIIDSDRLSGKNRKVKKGIRFMTIDEVAGLGENFDMLYELAKNFDYQILTMTIDPIGRFEEGKQHIYTLRKNNNPEYYNINPTPLAQFSMDKISETLEEYISALQTQN
ncbi:MAG: hypothetical protein FD123_166 [Bacteroidetes bacterium]|nr:MAG: hypothetical protein FD123_166 [Bacteroidota bacterium]